MPIETVLNAIFSPIMGLNPAVSIGIICTIITGILTFINKKTMGKTNAKEVKQKMEKARSEMLEAQKSGDKEIADKQMKKMMGMNSEYMKSMIKPMSVSLVISMLLITLLFPWLRAVYSGKVILTIPASLPVIGGKALTWMWWYMICSLGVGLALRKILKM